MRMTYNPIKREGLNFSFKHRIRRGRNQSNCCFTITFQKLIQKSSKIFNSTIFFLHFYHKNRYRLIRHEIFLNVDECLAIEANCNVANQISEEIGLDIIIKNTNQTHHLYNINLTLGDLFIFCDKFSLDFKRVFCKLKI